MWKVRELADKVTNVVMNYTDIEARVREATNDEPWGPTGAIKHELAQATFSYDQFPEVMGMLWKRIAENKRSPRRIYKSLLLLHSLLLNGSERVVRATQDRMYELRSLTEYVIPYDPGFNINTIIPPSGVETKDAELNVRVKAKELCDLVQNEEKLRDERKKAKKNRDKYVGIGSDRMTNRWTDDYSHYDDEFKSSNIKPFSDNIDSNSDTFNNHHSSSSGNNFKSKAIPRPPTPVDDDFDPRAEENGDFGDFASATIPKPGGANSSTKKIVIKPLSTSVSTPAALSSGGGGDDEFADFQSAFGNTTTVSESNSKSDSLVAALDAGPTTAPSTNSNNNSDLLGLNFDIGGQSNQFPQQSTTPAAAASFLSMSQVGSTSIPSTMPPIGGGPAQLIGQSTGPVSFPVAFPQNMSPVGVAPSAFPSGPAPATGMSFPMQTAAAQPQNSALDLLGGDISAAPVLLPQSNHGANNAKNNNVNNNNNNHAANGTATALKGTTWSDLNISIDNLSLTKGNSRQDSSKKTPMNQMALSTPSTNNTLGFP